MSRNRDQRGVVLPTRLMVFSISAVALAGLIFVATQGDDDPDTAAPVANKPAATAPVTPGGTPPAKPQGETPDMVVTPSATTKPPAPVRRGKVGVVVFNNSNITGLAGKTATRASGAGWNVIGTDNWFGKVDASTVYYGPKLKDAAALLAKDLGIASVKPAIAPMRADRLTVILTADYQ